MAADAPESNTDYDALLNAGVERDEARRRVHGRVDEVLAAWRAVP